jgi:hypothetical protein
VNGLVSFQGNLEIAQYPEIPLFGSDEENDMWFTMLYLLRVIDRSALLGTSTARKIHNIHTESQKPRTYKIYPTQSSPRLREEITYIAGCISGDIKIKHPHK